MIVLKGRVIDGNGGEPIEKGAVVVEGDRITAVCRQGEYPIPENAEVHEIENGSILPGLIDLHTHLAQGDDFMRIYTEHIYHAVLRAADNMKKILDCGFTSVRECGGLSNFLKAPWEEGLIDGPRICSAGKSLTQVAAGHHDFIGKFPVEFAELKHYIAEFVCGPDDVRRVVRMNFREGADFVKIFLSSPGGTVGRKFEFQELSDVEVRTAVEEAENFGSYVAAHVHSSAPIKAALRCGVKSIEHGTMLDDEDIELMLKNGAWLVPTLATGYVSNRYYEEHQIPLSPALRERHKMLDEHRIEALQKAHRAGVTIGCGCDFGGGERTPFGCNGLEIQLLSQLGGLSPMQAILAATKTAAKIILRADELGTLEPGKLADIVMVSGDPLADISLLSDADNVKMVMQGGAIKKNLGC